MNQSEQDCQWDTDTPKTDYELQFLTPKDLLKVVRLLKQEEISTLKIKFSFPNQFEKRLFLELLREEQKDQYFRESRNDKQTPKMKRKELGLKGNGLIFEIGSRLRSQIFMKAYRGNRIDELERNCAIKIHNFGSDIYIESDSKVRKDSIVYSELLDMHKRLKLFIFYNDERLWNVVTNSEQFKKRLQKIGIHSFSNQGRRKHVAFYSFEFQPEEIRKEILKENSFQPRVLKLTDSELPLEDNLRIFDVVVKSIRPTIELIRNTYEANLEVNKNNCCFVLHLKHEAFAQEPVAKISATVSNLFIMSFPLRNSRSFINELKRNGHKYPFVNATHYSKTAFCCIDRSKVKNKKDILSIFAPFLDALEPTSSLTLHLKPNCVLQQNSTMPSQILDLAEKFKLDVEDYQRVMNSQKFNIVIRPKLFNNQSKKPQKQMQLSKFLIELLMLEENQKQVTEDQLNQSINSLVRVEEAEKPATRSGRGNRMKPEQKQQNKMEMRKQQFSKKKQEMPQPHPRNSRQRNQNREAKNQSEKKQFTAERSDETWSFEVQFQMPSQLDSDQLFKRQKKDSVVEEAIETKERVKIKCWKLKVNMKRLGLPPNVEEIVVKEKCFLAQKIETQPGLASNLKLINLREMKDQEIAYLVYKAQDGHLWVPTHMIQRFET